MLKADEVYQFYVSRPARGSGVAQALIADAETRLAASGVSNVVARLRDRQRAGGAVLRKERVASRAGTVVNVALRRRRGGASTLDVWRYEKTLTP